MIARDDLKIYLDQFLACQQFKDYAPNGLQIEGRGSIQRIATAVSAAEQTILEALNWQADALLVHHGYFWRGEAPEIIGMKQRRVGLFLKNEISLFAYHLPLDCHPVLGNNAMIANLLALRDCQQHKASDTSGLLWSGSLVNGLDSEAFLNKLTQVFRRVPVFILAHDRPIKRIAWCSGAAQDLLPQAAELKVDAYLSGEISERNYYEARELGLHYYSCGHHATERFGIQALGAHLAEQFSLDHQFIDSDNPI